MNTLEKKINQFTIDAEEYILLEKEKETIRTNVINFMQENLSIPIKIEQFTYTLIYDFLWIIEVLLLLRFLFKLFGANPLNMFVAFLYNVSMVIMGPFGNTFSILYLNGTMSLDLSVIVAMVFYALVAYLLISLMRLLHPQSRISIT